MDCIDLQALIVIVLCSRGYQSVGISPSILLDTHWIRVFDQDDAIAKPDLPYALWNGKTCNIGYVTGELHSSQRHSGSRQPASAMELHRLSSRSGDSVEGSTTGRGKIQSP